MEQLIIKEVILNRANDYYELLRDRAKNKYRELSEEEKNIKREYGKNRYHSMSEEKKKRLKEYQKNYREAKKRVSQMQICQKRALQNCYWKDIFCSFFYSFLKDKMVF